jgi:peroxiredoxin
VSTPWIAAFCALTAIVVLLALIVLGTLRRLAPLFERAEASLAAAAASASPGALPTGAKVPPFAAASVDGANFTEFDLRRTRTVLLFLGASCPACERLVQGLENGDAPELDARLMAVSPNADEASRLARSMQVTVVVDNDRSVARAFESEIVPHAFVIEDGRVLASGRPNGWDEVEALLEDAEKGGDHRPELSAEAMSSKS